MSDTSSTTITLTVENPVSGKEHELEVSFTFGIGNDGIGAYEFWGAKCYDHGSAYIEEWYDEVFTVVGKTKKYELKKVPEYISNALEKWINENEDKLMEKAGEDNYPEPDFDIDYERDEPLEINETEGD